MQIEINIYFFILAKKDQYDTVLKKYISIITFWEWDRKRERDILGDWQRQTEDYIIKWTLMKNKL